MCEVKALKFRKRRSSLGYPYTEILITYVEDGVERRTSINLKNYIADTPHARAHQAALFLKKKGVPHAT